MVKTTIVSRFLMVVSALLVLSGCSGISVNYDYDTATNFSAYKSFSWAPAPEGSAPQSTEMSGLLSNRIRSAIETDMGRKGFSKSEGSGDLLVIFHVGVQDKIQITDWGYRYSNYYYGYGGRQMDVYEYQEGQMVIDLIDAETKNLVWRGSGRGVVDQMQQSPEESQAKINNAVMEIMANFPPPIK